MGLIVRNFTIDDYLDTNMKTLCLFFGDTKNTSYVSEVGVPEDENYMMFISKQKGEKNPDWVEIVNPTEFLNDNLELKKIFSVDSFDMEYKSLSISLSGLPLVQLVKEILKGLEKAL